MAEYIEREAALRECQYDADGYVTQGIKAIPAADVKPVVRGYNKRHEWPSLFECSVCGWSCDDTYMGDGPYKFCPNCGADMREAECTTN